ncbi:hypothetical protein ACFOWM_12695 [Ferruginibacter yonginensis]|uniref:Uncharacterized protein n=1 Tax=Ferruginibacter yonginensis TaxID=1310416 RepID=A0ABV8QU78_9BACT
MENIFTLEEVEKLVKNAYEVGFCDGIDSIEIEKTNYSNSNDFWKKNIKDWIAKEISYIV